MEWSVEAPFHLKSSCVLHTESGPVPGKAGCCPRRQVCHEIPSRFDLFGTAIHANLEHSWCARDLFQFDLVCYFSSLFDDVQVDSRLCTLCNSGSVKTEAHVLLHCELYNDIRFELFTSLSNQVVNFSNDLDDTTKLNVILAGTHCPNDCAKACHLILKRRLAFMSTNL